MGDGAHPEYVSDGVVELLSRLGCRYLPLNPGASFRGLHDSLVNFTPAEGEAPVPILCGHEEIAVAAAHAYAKATDTVGCAVVHDLVGLMHASMAVFNAWCDRVPMVVLGGGGPVAPSRRRPIDWTHAANAQSGLVRPFVKWDADPVESQELLDCIAQAWQLASSEPRRPTYVTVDAALQEDPWEGELTVPEPAQFAADPPFAPDTEAVRQAAAELMAATSPVVVAGRVGLRAAATPLLVDLVEKLGAAYCDERNFVAFPTDHPHNLSGDGRAVAGSDVLLSVDVQDLNHLISGSKHVTGGFRSADAYAGRVIDCAPGPSLPPSWAKAGSAPVPVHQRLIGEPLATLAALVDAVDELLAAEPVAAAEVRARRAASLGRRHDELRARQEEDAHRGWDHTPIAVARMVADLWERVREEDWLLVTRNTRSWPEGVWRFEGAGQYLGHSGGGGIGYGPGALLGGGLAAQDAGKLAVGIVGDGDLLAGPSALWTAAHHRLPLLVVVHDNRSFYNDEEHQAEVAGIRGRPVGRAHVGTRMHEPDIDYAAMARAHGAWAEGPVESPDDLLGAFDKAVTQVRAGRVALVDVRTAAK